MGNSISNSSQNINVRSNYKNRNYGSTIGNSHNDRTPKAGIYDRYNNETEEFEVFTAKTIDKEKSETTKQLENYISTLENMISELEKEKEELLEKSRRFADSANRGACPGLFIETKNQGSRKKYLNPTEALKSEEYFTKYLKENGYPTDKNRMTSEKYQLLKNEYANYINTTYTNKYNEYFKEKMGMTYAEYRERVTQINSDLETIKASKYELVQQVKEQPYIELLDTDEFKNYVSSNKNNPNSKLYYLEELSKGNIISNDNSMRFNYFTEQDRMIYAYLYDTYSATAAKEFIDAIEDKLNKAEGLAKANKFLDNLRDENGNIDPNVWAGILSGGKGFENGVLTFFDGIGNLFNSEGMMSVTQYEQMYILNELTNSSGNYINKLATQINETKGEEAAQEFISKMYTNNEINLEYAKSVLSEQEYNNLTIKIETDKKSILDNVYELSSSAGNMLPSMIVSFAVSAVATPAAGSVVGSTLMGVSSAGNSKNQALIQGNDMLTSTMYGIFSGVSETTLGLLLGNIPGLNVSSSFSIKGIMKEGLEELAQEYVDAGLRATILDETIDTDQLSKDALKSFLYGTIMSGVMNGGKLAFTVANSKGSIKITSIKEAVTFLEAIQKYDNANQISEEMVRIKENRIQKNVQNSNSNIYSTSEAPTSSPVSSTMETSTSSSISSAGVDIESQIARANMYTEKGNFASIDVSDISMMTDEVLSSIKNIDSVRFRLQDGSSISYNELLSRRNSVGVIQENKTSNISNNDVDLNAEYRIDSEIFKKYKNAEELQYAYMHNKIKMNLKEYYDAMRAFEVRDIVSLKNKTGIELEKIFFDDDYVVGVHRTGIEGDADTILKNGLYLTGHALSGGAGNTGGIDLKNNITFHTDYIDFIRALSDGAIYKTAGIGEGDAIIVKIPKSDIKNFDKIIDFSNVTPVLKPEYLVGSVRSKVDSSNKKIKIMDITYNIKENVDNISATDISYKKIMQNSDFNRRNLIQGIIGNLPSDADQLTIARIIYLKLNQAVTYSDTFFASTDETLKSNVYHQKYDINDLLNMNSNEIICSGWSQLYKELLICAGFDESKVKIESGKGDASHKYISVDFGNGQLLLADGTSNISGITDLAASKIGDGTAGFAFVDKLEYEKLKSSGLNTIGLFKQISSNKDIIASIDDTIGYSNSDFMKKINDVTDYYWHEGIDISTEDKVKKFVEIFDNENQSAVESHAIFQRYAKNIIGKDIIDVIYRKYGGNFVSLIEYKKSDGSIGYVIKKNKSKIRISDNISDIISEINSYAK